MCQMVTKTLDFICVPSLSHVFLLREVVHWWRGWEGRFLGLWNVKSNVMFLSQRVSFFISSHIRRNQLNLDFFKKICFKNSAKNAKISKYAGCGKKSKKYASALFSQPQIMRVKNFVSSGIKIKLKSRKAKNLKKEMWHTVRVWHNQMDSSSTLWFFFR